MWSGWETNWKLGILVLIGCLLIFNREMRPEVLNLKAAGWLPVYLVGVGAITFFSTFSGRTNPGHVIGGTTGLAPVIWAQVVSAVFALIIYYWAITVALPTKTIQYMIDEVVVPEEEGLESLGH